MTQGWTRTKNDRKRKKYLDAEVASCPSYVFGCLKHTVKDKKADPDVKTIANKLEVGLI